MKPRAVAAFVALGAASYVGVPGAVPLDGGARAAELAAVAWPSEASPAPKPGEWAGAQSVSVTRARGERASSCAASRVREWLKIHCGMHTAAIVEMAGSAGGLATHIAPAGDDRIPGDGEVVFPLRKGDRRVLAFWGLGPGYDGPLTVVPGVVLQEYWLGAAPVVLLTDALHEPVPTGKSGP